MFSATSYFKSHYMSCHTEGSYSMLWKPAGYMASLRGGPEFVSGEDDPSLQQQRAEHPEEKPQTQTGEQALKVHMLQT